MGGVGREVGPERTWLDVRGSVLGVTTRSTQEVLA